MAATDVLTLAEGKHALDIGETDSSKDVDLAAYIIAVSSLMDVEFGPVVARTITAEPVVVSGAWGYGPGVIRTRWFPVLSFTAVTEYVYGAGTSLTVDTGIGALPSAGYFPERYKNDPTLYSGVIRRRSGGYDYPFPPGTLTVAVTYSAGRFVDTAAVDGRWKTAAHIALKNLWENRGLSVQLQNEYDVPVANFPRFALPNAVVELLGGERQRMPGIG